MQCPKCDNKMKYYKKYSKWFCVDCRKSLGQLQKKDTKKGVLESQKSKSMKNKVKFVRKYSTGRSFYEVYKCKNVETAKKFLLTKEVDKQQYYILVETPMGNWGMDIKGLYKEHLLPWQKKIDLAEVEGSAFGMADLFSLEMAAKGFNDNFLLEVECGNCSHNWKEGLRYQDWTVVRCPKCHKKNKISSESYTVLLV